MIRIFIFFITAISLANCVGHHQPKSDKSSDYFYSEQKDSSEGKSSSEMMLDAESILLAKRDTIDLLIDSINLFYVNKFGKTEAAKRMVFLNKSQELFLNYKDQMRDLYCFESDESGSGWSENEERYNYVNTLQDARINQLKFLLNHIKEIHE